MRGVHVVLEQLVLAEGGGADRALVRQVRRLQGLAVVLGHVVQQLPLVDLRRVCLKSRSISGAKAGYLAAHGAPAAVLALVGGVLHAGRHQAVAAQQVSLQTLVREEPELAFLTI